MNLTELAILLARLQDTYEHGSNLDKDVATALGYEVERLDDRTGYWIVNGAEPVPLPELTTSTEAAIRLILPEDGILIALQPWTGATNYNVTLYRSTKRNYRVNRVTKSGWGPTIPAAICAAKLRLEFEK